MTTSKSLEKHYDYWCRAAFKMTNGVNHLDLVHQCIEYVSDQDKFTALCKSGDIRHYVTRVMAIQYFSKTSNFNKLYAPPHVSIGEASTDHEDQTWVGSRLTTEQLYIVISRLPEPCRSLVELYVESQLSMRELAVEIGLNEEYVINTINFGLGKIRKYVSSKRGSKSSTDGNL